MFDLKLIAANYYNFSDFDFFYFLQKYKKRTLFCADNQNCNFDKNLTVIKTFINSFVIITKP
jgi:hypothetical protein